MWLAASTVPSFDCYVSRFFHTPGLVTLKGSRLRLSGGWVSLHPPPVMCGCGAWHPWVGPVSPGRGLADRPRRWPRACQTPLYPGSAGRRPLGSREDSERADLGPGDSDGGWHLSRLRGAGYWGDSRSLGDAKGRELPGRAPQGGSFGGTVLPAPLQSSCGAGEFYKSCY